MKRNSIGRIAIGVAIVMAASVLTAPAQDAGGVRLMSLDDLKLHARGEMTWPYANYTSGRGKGSASLTCPSPAVVGETITESAVHYTAGEGGIAPGGMVEVWFPRGSTPPQMEDADDGGFLEVSAGDRPVEASTNYVYYFRKKTKYVNKGHKMMATALLAEGLSEGETLTFRRTKAYVGRYARRWEGDRFRHRVYVDHDADGMAEEIAESPWVPKVPAEANRIVMRAQSMALVGEAVRLTVMAMDRFDNCAISYRGTVRFSTDDPDAALPEPRMFTEFDAGCHTFTCTFSKPGFHWVTIEDETARYEFVSNPIEVFVEEPDYRLYWGDLHVHTDFSADAISGAHTTTSYPGAYEIGRYRYGLDFMANTDHHGINSYSATDWEFMKRVTNDANVPGTFATLLAVEVSHGRGDQNVYFRGDTMPYLPGGANHPYGLWEFLADYECIAIPHHFAQSMRPWQWDNYDEKLMVVAEIYSNHGRGEFYGNEPHFSWHDPATLEGYCWRDQLNKGRRIGCIAASDDHWSRPGYCGLAGVWAKSLTRADIYDNIKLKHCYASSNARAILHFTLDGQRMGSVVKTSGRAQIAVRAACPTDILEAAVIKNDKVVHAAAASGRAVELAWEDPDAKGGSYYYVRITMEGRPTAEDFLRDKPEFVWSAPIWTE